MRYGSVCSGIEAASVAWDPLGWSPAWLAEIEPFPCGALAHHYPSVPNLGDFTRIRSAIADGSVEAPDILVGGTPCQAFSVAGLRQSMGDARGQLTLEFVRLANAIDSARIIRGLAPAVVVWENVPGVLSAPDNAFGCFLGALAGEDGPLVPPGGRWANAGRVLGPSRAVAWRILDAQYFGVAQRRRRVFVVASAGTIDPSAVLFEREGVRRDSPPSREAGKVAPTIPSRSSAGGGLGTDFDLDGGLIPQASGGNHTAGSIEVAAALNANRGCHNPGDFEAGTLLATCVPGDVSHTLRAEGFDASEDGTGCGASAVAVGTLAIRGRQGESVLEARYDGTSNAILTPSGGRAGIGVGAVHISPVSVREVSQTITGNYGKQVDSSDTGLGPNVVFPTAQVRRLTPTECERLQGFPDGYTAIPWRGKPAEDCPDGPRYKALGNSMAVPVMRWIGQQIDLHLRANPLAFPPPGA